MFQMLIHLSSGACDLCAELFHGLYCSGSMCVGVTLWFGWGGVVSVCRLQPAYGYHTIINSDSLFANLFFFLHGIPLDFFRKCKALSFY